MTFRIRVTDVNSFFTALKLILFNVFLCLEATSFFLILPDDGDGVVLGRLALCEDAVKGLSAGGKLKRV